jgi:hypothetical protein
MSVQLLNYKGRVLWNNEEFFNPDVFYSRQLIPYGSDLVVIETGDGAYLIESFKKQPRVIGVVIQVKEHTASRMKVEI